TDTAMSACRNFSCKLLGFACRMDMATMSRRWRKASGPATERRAPCQRELEQDIVVANVRVQHRQAEFLRLGEQHTVPQRAQLLARPVMDFRDFRRQILIASRPSRTAAGFRSRSVPAWDWGSASPRRPPRPCP